MAEAAHSGPAEATGGKIDLSALFHTLLAFIIDLLHGLTSAFGFTSLRRTPTPQQHVQPFDHPPHPLPSDQNKVPQSTAPETVTMPRQSPDKTAAQAIQVASPSVQPTTAKISGENLNKPTSSGGDRVDRGFDNVGSQLVPKIARLALEDTTNAAKPGSGPISAARAGTTVALPLVPVDRQPEEPVKSPLPPVLLEVPISSLETLVPLTLRTADGGKLSAENMTNARFMREALDMAHQALKTNETPVGCVLVYKGRVIAKGMNATNVTRNGTRHAELMAIGALLSYTAPDDVEPERKPRGRWGRKGPSRRTNNRHDDPATWGDVDPKDGHLYPYGQKLHPSPKVDKSVVNQCVLYVTVEPCVMCASLLRQLGIRKVYFGAVNDKFGGTGGVLRIHENSNTGGTSTPTPSGQTPGKNHRARTPKRADPSNSTSSGLTNVNGSTPGINDSNGSLSGAPPGPAFLEGHGGNVEPGFGAEGGWGRDEAVTLLRQFYVQENGRAPVPRKKEGRAARLAAIMEREGHAGGSMTMTEAVSEAMGSSDETAIVNQEPVETALVG